MKKVYAVMWGDNFVSLHLSKYDAHRSSCYEVKELHDDMKIKAFQLNEIEEGND